jgi:antitoxin component YwqK of YwqJK toxin-antitoxin module
MSILRQALTALLAGLTYKTGNEIHWENEDGEPITVEPVDIGEYRNGQRHGKWIKWYEDGNKLWEEEYQNGQKHGKCIDWYENGNKRWEYEWQNGQLIKTALYGRKWWHWIAKLFGRSVGYN